MKAKPNLLFTDEIFEIRLLPDVWEKISQAALAQELTYSWIVRMCIFKMQQNGLERDLETYQLHRRLKRAYIMNDKPLHRHQLCLYGVDGLHLRILAASLGFTISQVVRFALEWYLDEVISLLRQGCDFVAMGTKIFERMRGHLELVTKFHNKSVNLEHFAAKSYWPFQQIRRFPWQIPRGG